MKQLYINIHKEIKNDSEVRFILIMPVVGLVYYGFILATGNSIPCLFRKLTGYFCPGCGLTTMFIRIGKADFHGAFRANPAIFILLPLVVLWYVAYILHLLGFHNRLKKTWHKHNSIIRPILLIYLLIFGIIRNVL